MKKLTSFFKKKSKTGGNFREAVEGLSETTLILMNLSRELKLLSVRMGVAVEQSKFRQKIMEK